MFPSLPVIEIRDAIARSDWPQASALLEHHHQSLDRALTGVDVATSERVPLMTLLLAQRELLEEMRLARDAIGDALAQLTQGQRGARGWLRELA